MKYLISISKIILLAIWAFLGTGLPLICIGHALIYLALGPIEKLVSPTMGGFVLVSSVCCASFYYALTRTKFFEISRR